MIESTRSAFYRASVLYVTGLLCSLLSTEVALAQTDVDPFRGEKPHYFYRGSPIEMDLLTDRIGIVFDRSFSDVQRDEVLASLPDVTRVVYENRSTGMAEVELQRGTTRDEILERVAVVATRRDVKYVTPVFDIEGYNDILLTDTFLASFESFVTVDDIYALNDEYKVEIVDVKKLGHGFPDRYTLRPRLQSPLESLATANAYYETGMAIYSTPNSICTNIYELENQPRDEFVPDQWHIPKIDLDLAWDSGQLGDNGIVVAVMDSGVSTTHDDLWPRRWVNPNPTMGDVNGYNFPDGNGDISARDFHGTPVTGVISALTDNCWPPPCLGVAGITWNGTFMTLIAGGTPLQISHSIEYAADHGASILNMSWTRPATEAIEDALTAARATGRNGLGVVLVASSGNQSETSLRFPSSDPNVIGVGATKQDDGRRAASNYGPRLDLVAPGTSILTTDYNDGYTAFTGTSFAAPIVAGVAALVLSENPTLTAAQVQAVLQFSADDEVSPVQGEDGPGRDLFMGYGRVNAFEAVKLANARRVQFRVNDGSPSGRHIASFDDRGNLVIEGDLTLLATQAQLAPTSAKELIVRNNFGTNQNYAARLTESGDFFLGGFLSETSDFVSGPPPADSWAIHSSTGEALAYIDHLGSLYLKGRIFVAAAPDSLESQGLGCSLCVDY